jgi:hypothetical protein
MIYFQRADRLGRILGADLGAGIIMVDLRGAPAAAAFDRLIDSLAAGLTISSPVVYETGEGIVIPSLL